MAEGNTIFPIIFDAVFAEDPPPVPTGVIRERPASYKPVVYTENEWSTTYNVKSTYY